MRKHRQVYFYVGYRVSNISAILENDPRHGGGFLFNQRGSEMKTKEKNRVM